MNVENADWGSKMDFRHSENADQGSKMDFRHSENADRGSKTPLQRAGGMTLQSSSRRLCRAETVLH